MTLTSDLVHFIENDGDRPQTHAIVIGIGCYPHGLEVDGVGLENLDSPVTTARFISDWLITAFEDPDRPLGSVSLLVSDGNERCEYQNPCTGDRYQVPQATTADVVDAIDNWATRSGSNFDNASILYYCGHGLRSGVTDYLITRSFGAKPNQFLDAVLDRSSIDGPMRLFGPGHQIFIYDTCRTDGGTLLGSNPSARTVLSARQSSSPRIPRQSKLFAAAEGASAHGRPGGLSLFADELRKGARHTAAKKNAARKGWWLNTGAIQDHMQRFLNEQTCQIEGEQLDVSFLGEPPSHIPVVLRCDPVESISTVDIECHSGENRVAMCEGEMLPDDGNQEWRLALGYGSHTFSAEAHDRSVPKIEASDIHIAPPYVDVVLDTLKGRFL